MPRDPRAFITVANGMPEHPKVDPLSDAAFRGLIEAWCLCSRTRNDGHIPKATWLKKIKPKARKELLAVGLATDNGLTIDMHDYLDHQTSAAEIEETRKKRAQAGAVGGKRKAQNLASATANDLASATANGVAKRQQNSGPDVPEVEVEVEERKKISTHQGLSAYESNEREIDLPRGPSVSGQSWKLVRDNIPDEHPHTNRAALALQANELILAGTAPDTVADALRLWLDKPTLGPRALKSLVSEVIKTRSPTNGAGRPSTADQRFAAAQALKTSAPQHTNGYELE